MMVERRAEAMQERNTAEPWAGSTRRVGSSGDTRGRDPCGDRCRRGRRRGLCRKRPRQSPRRSPFTAHGRIRSRPARTRDSRGTPPRHPKRCMRECLQGNAPPRTSTLLAPRFNRLGDFGCGMCPTRSAVIKPPLNHACKCEFPQDLIVGAVVRLSADDLDHGFLCWAHDGLRWSRETGPENKG